MSKEKTEETEVKTSDLPTVSIQGKDYVLVKDRVLAFNDMFKNGMIETALVSYQNGQVVIKAKVVPDVKVPERYFTGYSQEKEGQGYINKTSALENAETSAVGRALAMMGIGVIESVASADEMNKAIRREEEQVVSSPNKTMANEDLICETCGAKATERQGVSKAGKAYHGIFCSTDDKTHTRWL